MLNEHFEPKQALKPPRDVYHHTSALPGCDKVWDAWSQRACITDSVKMNQHPMSFCLTISFTLPCQRTVNHCH